MGEMLTYILAAYGHLRKDWTLLQERSVNSGASISSSQSLLS